MRKAAIMISASFILLAGCKAKSGYSSHGVEVITADAAAYRQVDVAMLEVHRNLANYIEKDDGSKSDPTYHAGSNNVKSDGKLKYARSYLEWKDKNNNLNRIETTQIADELIVIICESDDKETNIALHNEIVRQLEARGLEYRE